METTEQNSEEKEYDVTDKAKELYDKLGKSLSTEKLLELKDFIKEFSDECKTYNMFTDAKPHYDHFVEELMKIPDAEKRIIAAWNHFDGKLAAAPTFMHFKATVILVVPLLNHALENYSITPAADEEKV